MKNAVQQTLTTFFKGRDVEWQKSATFELTIIGRAGASPPSRATGLNFLPFDRVPTTLRMRALRANVKPAHCKFKGRTFSANFLPLQAPVFFPQPTILALGRCQRLLNRFLYGHLHMKQQPRYAFSTYAMRPCCPPVNSLLSAVFDLLP